MGNVQILEKNKKTKLIISSDDKDPQPFLKWVGGKKRLIPQLQQFFPSDFNEFYEPFVGGGAVFFSLKPVNAKINDTNQVLIGAYKLVKNNKKFLIAELKELEKQYLNKKDISQKEEFYYSKRQEYNSLPFDSKDKSVLLFFLNKTCFNGVYRENKQGGFNVPFGKQEKPPICNEQNIRAVSKLLKNTSITSKSFEKAVKSAGENDFIYFDPPYDPLTPTASFTSYHADGFNEIDQKKLRDVFVELSNRGCKVMLSNSDTDFIRQLYKGYKINIIKAARSINSVGHKRGAINELVITNY